VGQRPAVKRTVDGTTYDVRDHAQGQAGSAADILNTIPSVAVSPDGAVSVRGDGNVQIYVNGRPSTAMKGEGRAAALEAMSGGSIASVELITNPSARFSANGGTIVNIQLKAGKSEGLHGQASANAGDHGRKSLSLSSTYGSGALSASVNASLRDAVRFTHVHDERTILSADGSQSGRFVTDSRYTPTHAESASLNASIGYRVSATANVGMDLSWSEGSPKNRVYEHHLDYGAKLEAPAIAEYRRVRGGTYANGSRELSVYYDDRGAPGGASLKLVGQHGGSSLDADRLFTTFRDFPPGPSSGERVFSGTWTRFDRVAIDHERSIGGRLRLGLGAEWKGERHRFDNGRGDFDPALPGGMALQRAVPGLNRFEAAQRSTAAYASLQLKSGAWTLQAGERYEALRVETRLAPGLSDESRNVRNLGGFDHSLSILRDIGDDQAILRLSRSRQRFDLRDLNPSIVYVDAQNIYSGNPRLAPQGTLRAEAEYAFGGHGRDGSAILYYRRTDRTIADYSRLLPENVIFTSKRNGGRSQSVGAQSSLSGATGKAVKYSFTGNMFWSQLSVSGEVGNQVRSLFSYTLQASIDWAVTPRDQLHVDANLQGPSLVPQGRRSGTGAANFVWRRSLRAWSLSLAVQGLVQKWRVHSVLSTLNGLDINDRRNGGRSVTVGAAHAF
jgi:hypothetical protein